MTARTKGRWCGGKGWGGCRREAKRYVVGLAAAGLLAGMMDGNGRLVRGAADDQAITPATTEATTTTSAPAATVPVQTNPENAGTATAPTEPTSQPTTETAATSSATESSATLPATEPAPNATATTAPAGTPTDGHAYPVSSLVLHYDRTLKGEPAVGDLLQEQVVLGKIADGYVAMRPGAQKVTIKLGDIGKNATVNLYGSAFGSIYTQLVHGLNKRGLFGVFVVADPKEISNVSRETQEDRDLRPAGQTTLDILVYVARVKELRTVTTTVGKEGAQINLPQQASIRDHSPVKPGDEGLLRKNLLDDYVLFLNRQPGRRVDVAVSAAGNPGDVVLDYLVAESRPWYVYAQVSNTGTKQTRDWRERFGFVDNQLTHHDDILTLDYATSGFDKSQSVLASYDFPIFGLNRLRNKFYANWTDFTASDVGIDDELFTGTSWTVGDEVAWNFFQQRELFVDAFAGGHYLNLEVTDESFDNQGHGDYVLPYLGLRATRTTDITSTYADITATTGITNSSQTDLDGLGRPNVNRDFSLVQGSVTHSLYLEPLLSPEAFVRGNGSLAHELFFSARGQYAFDNRLVPQIEDVAGGFYTVRGYPESVAAGDSMVVGTAEYRFHVPRAFGIEPDPTHTRLPITGEPFRFRPQQMYGRADWDLIARTFLDVGETVNSDRESFEHNDTLVGTGVGMEFQYKQNFNVRVDWESHLRALKMK